MRTLTTALLVTLFLMPLAGLTARADGDEHGDRGNRGGASRHGCVNPAGHERGWCKHGERGDNNDKVNSRSAYATISGTVIAINGDIAQFREDNGSATSISQRTLLNSGMGLNVGSHYTLRGYWSNNLFVAQANGGSYGNGYPRPGSNASVRGVITAINNNRVTIMQGLFSSITINDQQALNNGSAQNLYVGRTVTAYGYWNGGVFYATSLG